MNMQTWKHRGLAQFPPVHGIIKKCLLHRNSNHYLTGELATWGEGDWNGAPGGSVGDPRPGDGVFDQNDIIAAAAPGHYLSGLYAAATSLTSDRGLVGDVKLIPVPAPEPGSVALLGLGLAGVLLIRPR
jgi:hypothetical protein